MGKKWDTVISADLKRLFLAGHTYVPLVTKGLRQIQQTRFPIYMLERLFFSVTTCFYKKKVQIFL
jgi:hypothetical protein